jgi:hypothetical protein
VVAIYCIKNNKKLSLKKSYYMEKNNVESLSKVKII